MKNTLKNCSFIALLLTLIFIYPKCSSNKETNPPPPPPPPSAPTLESVTPDDGIIGDQVTLKGKNLETVDKITFNGIATLIIKSSGTSITTVVPPDAVPGANKISVHAAGGTSNELSFTVYKEPDHVDDAPPTLSSVSPSSTYSDYPVLIDGDNLSGVLKITFNDKGAVIYTNNKTVITATVPKDISAGSVTIQVKTLKGTSSIKFQVQGPPPTPAGVNFSIVTLPPPNYVTGISNQWSCGLSCTTLFSQISGDTSSGKFVDFNSQDASGNFTTDGLFRYKFDYVNNYCIENYIKIINHLTNDTLSGQFSSKFGVPCIDTMVLVSSKNKNILTYSLDRKANSGDPNFPCGK